MSKQKPSSIKVALKVNGFLLLLVVGIFAIGEFFLPENNLEQTKKASITFKTRCAEIAYYKKEVQQNVFFIEKNANIFQKILDTNPYDKEANNLALDWLEYWNINSLNYHKVGHYYINFWQGHALTPSPVLSSDVYMCKEKGEELDNLLTRTEALFKKYGYIFYSEKLPVF